MVDVKACRICLNLNVPLFNLLSDPLKLYFETLIGENLLMNGLPPYACADCTSQINKYYLFRERCFHGQNLLYTILCTEGRVSIESIKSVNQEPVKLNVCVQTPIGETIFESIHGDDVDVKSEAHDIEENNEDDTEVKSELHDTEDDNKDHEEVQPESHDMEKVHEKSADDAKMESDELSSDDEPLSHKKKNIKKIETNHFEETAGTNTETCLTGKLGRPRRVINKIQRPRRTQNTGGVDLDDEDLEEYAIVIPLTLQEQTEEIEKRKTSSNYLNSGYKCNLCYKGYIDSLAWKHHVMKHDPSAGDYVCEICKFRFKTRRSLLKHSSTHDTKYQCKVCPFVSKSATQAKQHHRWHKGVTYSCEHCNEVFTKWTSYLSHVRMKHPSEHICGVCGYSFVSQYGLNQHKSMMHKQETTAEEEQEPVNSKGDLYCELCDIKFENNEAWKRHVVMSAKHSNTDLPVGCRECGAMFRSTEELRVHHRNKHPRIRPRQAVNKDSRVWPAPCQYCSEVIANAREFWAHFRRNHRDRQYPIKKDHVCDVCGKSFRGNAFLVYHKRTHTEERTYKCGQCPKAFFNRTNLQSHEKSHSEVRPYPCTVCMKGFKSKGALDRHFRSHTGVKPYECEVCGKAFGQSNSRKLHVRTVHLKQPAPYVSRSRQKPKKETITVALACDFVYQ